MRVGIFGGDLFWSNHPYEVFNFYQKVKTELGSASLILFKDDIRLNKTFSGREKFYFDKNKQKIFEIFSTEDTFNWFESRKVPLYIQDDNRVFPKSNNSQTIIDCLLNDVEKLKIKLVLGLKVQKIKVVENQLKLIFENNIPNKNFDKIIIGINKEIDNIFLSPPILLLFL